MRQKIMDCVFEVMEEINKDLPAMLRVEPTEETVLLGKGGVYDSLNLINFFVSLEERIALFSDAKLDFLEDEVLLGRVESRLTAGDLADYAAARIARPRA